MPTATLSPDDVSALQFFAQANGRTLANTDTSTPPSAPGGIAQLDGDDVAALKSFAQQNGRSLANAPMAAPTQDTDNGATGGGAMPVVPGSDYAAMSPNERHVTDLISSATMPMFQAIEPFMEASARQDMANQTIAAKQAQLAKPNPSWGIPGTPIYNDAKRLGGIVSRPVVNGITQATFGKGGPPRFYDSNGQPIPTGDPRVAQAIGAPHPNMQASDVPQAASETYGDNGTAYKPSAPGFLNTIGPDLATAANSIGKIPETLVRMRQEDIASTDAANRASFDTFLHPGQVAQDQAVAQASKTALGNDVAQNAAGLLPYGSGDAVMKAVQAAQSGDTARAIQLVKALPAGAVSFIKNHPTLGLLDTLNMALAAHGAIRGGLPEAKTSVDNRAIVIPDAENPGATPTMANTYTDPAAQGVGTSQLEGSPGEAADIAAKNAQTSPHVPTVAPIAVPPTPPVQKQEPVTATSGSLTGLIDNSKQAIADIHADVGRSQAAGANMAAVEAAAERGDSVPRQNATPPFVANPTPEPATKPTVLPADTPYRRIVRPDGSSVVTGVTDAPTFSRALQDQFDYTPQQADDTAAIADARAGAFEAAGLGSKQDWYQSRVEQVNKGIDPATGKDSYIALKPEQIKSVHNRGTFDPIDPNILHNTSDGNAVAAIHLNAGMNGGHLWYGLKAPDFESGVHELGHVFLEDLRTAAVQGHSQSAMDLKTVNDWFNTHQGRPTDPQGRYTFDHENFANAFTSYLRNGIAPVPGLTGVFQRFSNWLTGLYKGVKDTPYGQEVSPAMRDVFDRMLGKQKGNEPPIAPASPKAPPAVYAGSINVAKLSDDALKNAYVQRATNLGMDNQEPLTRQQMQDQSRALGLTQAALMRLPVGWKPSNVHFGVWLNAVRDVDDATHVAEAAAKANLRLEPTPENAAALTKAKTASDATFQRRSAISREWGQTGQVLKSPSDPFIAAREGDLFRQPDTPTPQPRNGRVRATPAERVKSETFGKSNVRYTQAERDAALARVQTRLQSVNAGELIDCRG